MGQTFSKNQFGQSTKDFILGLWFQGIRSLERKVGYDDRGVDSELLKSGELAVV